MITEESVKNIVEQHIQGTEVFLVDVVVRPGNLIRVQVDRPEGISIDECVGISRHLNRELDRDVEDFSLEVSSPGIGVPFRVKQQYEKNIGRDIEVVLEDGTRTKGKLESVTGDGITVTGKKGTLTLGFNEIKSAREIISFS
ncbi:MAG: ribosome assembly cofactor RimP [Bacteroidales bacterium]